MYEMGKRYDYNYVNNLLQFYKKTYKKNTRLICFTDNKKNIDNRIICKPLPKIEIPKEISKTPWRKLSVWQYPLENLKGDIFFLDLDLVITNNIDKFFTYKPGTFCVIENWTQIGKSIGNTSCFRFPVKKYKFIFDDFEKIHSNVGKNFILNKFI